jgi:hypothetical protein
MLSKKKGLIRASMIILSSSKWNSEWVVRMLSHAILINLKTNKGYEALINRQSGVIK